MPMINKYAFRSDNGRMGIPPVDEHMQTFNAGAVTIGVEFRIVTDELIAALGTNLGMKKSQGIGSVNEDGVSLHVFVKAEDGNLERLRFDCFTQDPHYHYLVWSKMHNDHVWIDPTAHGDALAWSLEVIRTRLLQMLERAGVENGEKLVEQKRIDQILPLVTEAAYRMRYNSDKERITRAALAYKGGAYANSERLPA